jgi:hypothetical protein
MKPAVVERLADLEDVAGRLRELIDAEDPRRLLPGLAVARVAVAADRAVSKLARELDTLTNAQPGAKA